MSVGLSASGASCVRGFEVVALKMARIACFGFCIAFSVCKGVAQQIWRVHHVPGPGVDFTDLPQAVAAAAPGDEIWVYWYNGQTFHAFTAPVIDKPLRIVGFQVGSLPGTAGPTAAAIRGLVVIANIPAGQRVSLNGLQVGQVSDEPAGVLGIDCAGDIVLEDMFGTGTLYPNFGFHFERCQNVVVRGLDLYLGGRPMTVVDSNLLLSNSVINYLRAVGPLLFLSYPMTTETIRLVRSRCTLVGSIVRGVGDFVPFIFSHVSRNPVVLENSELLVGPGSLLQSPTQFAYLEIGSNIVQVDPRAVLAQAPVPMPPTEYLHSVYHDFVVVGEPYAVAASGPPGGFAVLMAGDYASPGIPTSFGLLAIEPASIVFGGVTPLSAATGSHLWFEQCSPAALIAHAYAFQAVFLSPDGTLQLSLPSPFTAGWQHGRIP
jgi:hypothetical protein